MKAADGQEGRSVEWMMVTNNAKCYERWGKNRNVIYREEWSYLDVLIRARNYVQRGWCLLTHPMAGSLKPNQMPYRSILLAESSPEQKEPYEDELLMENSIESYHKFIDQRPLTRWPETFLDDFRTVDLSLMESAVENSLMKNL